MDYKNPIVEIYEGLLDNPEASEKYGFKPGVYSIAIDNNVVYIGESFDMLWRIAEHIYGI